MSDSQLTKEQLDDDAFDKLVSLLIISAYNSGASGQPSGVVEQSAKAIKECFEHLQARVDALMLEYCPKEMTAAQIQRWAANQKQVRS